MAKNNIMLDLETLSTRKDAAIIQLAACVFDPVTGELGDAYNAFIKDSGGAVTLATIGWWMQQAPASKIGAAFTAADALTERAALAAFGAWLQAANPEALWSHGAPFDIVVLDMAYARHDLKKPWSYKIERDTRTLYALAPGGMPAIAVDPAQVHDARYDCDLQIQQVVAALRTCRG